MSDLYELPDGWEWKKMVDKEVCELIMGQSPKSDTYNTKGNGMPFFQGKTEFGDIYPTVVKYYTAPKKIAEIGDILLSVRAPVGPTNIANIQCAIGRGLGAIRPNIDNTLTNYLLYFFRNFEIEISQKGKGSTFSAITKAELENTDIPIPTLPEQQRIVTKLDLLFEKIDKSISLHQKNMDEADVFMGSVLNDVFGELEKRYKTILLEDMASFQNGFAFKSKEFNTNGEGLQVIRIGNVINLAKNPVYIDERIEFEKYKLKDNDIVISMTGTREKMDYLFVRIVNKSNSYLNQRVGKIQNKTNSDYSFLYYFLQSNAFRDKIFEFETGAVNQGNISGKDIMNREIANAPLNIQQKTVKYLDKISDKTEKIKSIQKEKMDNLKVLKASILDKAFRGEL